MRPVPEFLHHKLEEQYGSSLAVKIEAGFRVERACTLRVNTLKAARGEVRQALDEAGVLTETVAWYADALAVRSLDEKRARAWLEAHAGDAAEGQADEQRIPQRLGVLDVLRTHPLYQDGAIYLQNLSAMIPALVMAPRAGQAVLDMCAAPGGKTCQIAALSGGGALITACEKNAARAERLRYNLEKQGAGRANVMVCDARQLDPLFIFDAVLLDAPCSGSGTVLLADERQARKQRFAPDLLARTARTQRALLARALEAVPAGGVVTYSTCSVLADENEDVVQAALDRALLSGVSDDESASNRSANAGGRGRRRGGKKGGRGRKDTARAARFGALDDGWDTEGAAPGPAAQASRGSAGARRSPACELIPLDPERFTGVPLLPTRVPGTLCVCPTDRYEGFFVAQLKKL